MKRLLFILVLFFHFSQAQNLVPNPSFEEDTVRINKNIDHLNGVKSWFQATSGTSDYYNEKYNFEKSGFGVPENHFGFQFPKSGKAYCGFYTLFDVVGGGGEYIEAELLSPLVKDSLYQIVMHINIANELYSNLKDIGMLFTEDSLLIKYYSGRIKDTVSFNYIAKQTFKDTLNWILIKGIYKAKGGEKFVTIGNFTDENILLKYVKKDKLRKINIAIYTYIDDVLIMKKSNFDSLENVKYLQSIKDKKTRLQVYNYYKLSNTKDTSCFNEIRGMRELVSALKKDNPKEINLYLNSDAYLIREQDWLCQQEEFNWLQSFLQTQFPQTKINTYFRNAKGETLSNDTQEGIYYNHSVWVEW